MLYGTKKYFCVGSGSVSPFLVIPFVRQFACSFTLRFSCAAQSKSSFEPQPDRRMFQVAPSRNPSGAYICAAVPLCRQRYRVSRSRHLDPARIRVTVSGPFAHHSSRGRVRGMGHGQLRAGGRMPYNQGMELTGLKRHTLCKNEEQRVCRFSPAAHARCYTARRNVFA
jgi:hypothetical protein